MGPKPPSGAGSGWDLQAAADIEWAHAMAPSAKLYLVEANSNSLIDLLNAVGVATKCVQASGGGQVSIGWGTPDFSSETGDDITFTGAEVVYFAAVGDLIAPPPPETGVPYPPVLYPAASPNVIGVGGTTFSRNQVTGIYQSQTTWNVNYSLIGILYGTGGGPSANEPRPAYQNGIAKIVGSARGTPDLAALADPNEGFWIYNSTSTSSPGRGTFMALGGTAVATAITAGIANELGLFYPSSKAALTAIHANTGKVRTNHVTGINSGLCGPPGSITPGGYSGGYGSPYDPSFIEATTGISWDWCSGWGTLHETK
jgi:subtilase family serine protease